MKTTRWPGFFRQSVEARRDILLDFLEAKEPSTLDALDPGSLSLELADKLIENVVGVLGLPVGLGLNFLLNGEEILVPMAVEEPSVVAAFSHAAKLARTGGGFFGDADPSHMIGQIQLCPTSDEEADRAHRALADHRARIDRAAEEASAAMRARGGGFVRSELHRLADPAGQPAMLVVHLIVDVVDAMGANLVNHVAEACAPVIADISGVQPNLKILSNLAVHRLARARVAIPFDALGGEAIARGIAEADRFARLDPFRAATHNKGFMNGVDAVALATGNDWRALEAGAHAYAARDGQYRGLTHWRIEDDRLAGSVELPVAVGTVGGTTESHPTVRLLRGILGARDARQLATIFAAVGLAQNLAALKALVSEGIQRGHMSLHARQLAFAAGATVEEIDEVVRRATSAGSVTSDRVRLALTALRKERAPRT